MRALGAAASMLCVAILAGACDDRPPEQTPPAPGVLLEVDGLHIHRADIEDFDAYFEDLDPSMGRKYRIRELLAQYLIPLRAAQRDFATERQTALERATRMAAACDTYLDLSRKGVVDGGYEREEGVNRNDLPLPVARWAFQIENLSAASDPIETAQGYLLIAPASIQPGMTKVSDRLLAFIVPYNTLQSGDYQLWLQQTKERLRGQVTYLAPELEDCLPKWLTP